MELHATIAALNPFATRCVRPGQIVYQDPTVAPEDLVQKLESTSGRAAVVGPHGSGKTTLLYSLWPFLIKRFQSIRWLTAAPLASRNRSRVGRYRIVVTRTHGPPFAASTGPTLVIVDGFDSLSWFNRCGLTATAVRRGHGLLVTAHRSTSMPTLLTTHTTVERFVELAIALQQGYSHALSAAELDDCYRAAAGDMREAFFVAYDRYSAASRQAE